MLTDCIMWHEVIHIDMAENVYYIRHGFLRIKIMCFVFTGTDIVVALIVGMTAET